MMIRMTEHRPAMGRAAPTRPAFSKPAPWRFASAPVLACLLAPSTSALAQAPATPARPAAAAASASPVQSSALTAELFYQLLVGEMAARNNDPGGGFQMMLDAARRSNDSAVYQRAVEIALQARAGESALQAARAWRQAKPDSREATRFVLQILLALNRVGETAEPLRQLLALSPPAERATTLALVPRLYARASDKAQAQRLVEQALADAVTRPETAGPAWTAIARMRLAAGQEGPALEAAQRAQSAAPTDEGPALLALELIDPRLPQAEALVRRYLDGAQARPEVRLAYARTLLEAQRTSDARLQLQLLTRQKSDFAEAWLVQGVLQVQDNQLEAGEASLQKYLSLLQAGGRAPTEETNRGLAQAYLALAQAAERRGDLARASQWLDRIPGNADLLATQVRRASVLARQGRLDDARKLLRALPDRDASSARAKVLAEVHLLRDNRQVQAAYDLLSEAVARSPADHELLYEQATTAEKLGRLDEMERLLRRAMVAKPDFQHAYNALGYSLADRNVRLPEARDLIRKALELAPGDPFITDSLGWVEFRMGNKAEALRLLELAFRERPDAEIAAHLGEVLWSLGNKPRALEIWREGLSINRENETLQSTLRRLQVKP
jgi:tetratricopeptide (TPR) repeat protein